MSTSINLYPEILLSGSMPDSSGAEIDRICEEIHKATKGWGTNENRLLKALGGCNPIQRCQVPTRYFQKYNQNLQKLMESECGNRCLGRALQYIAVDPVAAECEMIFHACKGIGTDEALLFSIIAGRSNDEIKLLKKRYKELKNRDLLRHICLETSGNVETLAKLCLEEHEETFDPSRHNDACMERDAEQFYRMGVGRLGTNERGWFQLLCHSPPHHIQGVNSKYKIKYGHDMVQAVKREMSGTLETATLILLGMKLNPYEQAAKLINDACKGIGTNELLLTCHVIRYQKIMSHVNASYQTMYKRSVQSTIKSELSGQFERLLVEISQAC